MLACSIIAIILTMVALLELTEIMKLIWIKLLVICFVTIPLIVVYNDYKMNVKQENEREF